MKTTKTILAILSLALAVACSEKKEETNAPTNEPVVSAKPGEEPKTAEPTAPMAAAPAGEAIGVAECDAYITKYSACLEKAPADQKAALQKSFDDLRAAWRTSAATPEGKTTLAQTCTAAIDAAKTATTAWGCQF